MLRRTVFDFVRWGLAAVVLALPASGQPAGTQQADPILGFSPAHALAERGLEARFQSLPSGERAREWHRIFTAEPHPAASAENNKLAAVMARAWREQGWEQVTLRRYDVLHSRPRTVTLEMTAPARFKAPLREDPYDRDPDTRNPAIDGAYFGYSASGDVTAELVYAHSGNPEDYALLHKNGISVKGKVVIVRYSNPDSYRGFKALVAERGRRRGVADLLRSCRRRLRARQGIPGRPVGPREPHPARRDHLRLHRARRPDDPGLGVGSWREAYRSGTGALAAEDPGIAALLARRQALARAHERCGGAAGVARRPAHHVPLQRRRRGARPRRYGYEHPPLYGGRGAHPRQRTAGSMGAGGQSP